MPCMFHTCCKVNAFCFMCKHERWCRNEKSRRGNGYPFGENGAGRAVLLDILPLEPIVKRFAEWESMAVRWRFT